MATTPYTLNVVNGTELQLSLTGPTGPAGPVGPAGDPTALLSSANTWTDTQSFLGFTVNGLSFYGPFSTFTYTGSSAETHRTALGAAAAVHTHVSDDITDATDNAESGKIAKYTSTSGLFSLGLELYNGTSTTDLTPENGSANYTITVPASDGMMALTSDLDNISFADLDDLPNSLDGYGITDAAAAVHASTHATGGSDPITPASIGAETPAGAAAQIAFANRTARQRPYRLAIGGDSITAQNNNGNSYGAGGYASVARSILGRRFELVWRAWNTKPATSPTWNFGSSGFSAVEYRDGDGSGELPMQDIQNVYEHVDGVFILLGSNPGADVSVDAAAIADIWDTLLAAGKDVYGAEVLPRSSTVPSAATVAARIIALNALLKTAAASRGIPFLEWHSDFADESGYCSLVDMPDGVHPGFIGAQKAARLFAAFMSPFVSTHGWEAPDAASTAWLTVNPYMMGTDASTPTSWNFPASATAQSVVRDSLGRWKRITNTQVGYTARTYRQNVAAGTWKVGDRVRGVMRVRADSGFDMRALTMRLIKTGGSTVTLHGMEATSLGISEETGVLDGLDDMIYITPEYIVPSDATGLYVYFSPCGSGTFDVMYCGIVAAERFDS